MRQPCPSCRTGARVVNVSRGELVDTDALTRQVASGRLRTALDVTTPEALPAGHPLWQLHGGQHHRNTVGELRQPGCRQAAEILSTPASYRSRELHLYPCTFTRPDPWGSCPLLRGIERIKDAVWSSQSCT
ncbi:NAD(P)-dependent oxidoreductase [Streptomyces sp. NRRL WC-3744]|uniref:NAD(P)-dependent oxidoreductase n=1 Tax=Streptomyces sp. NRRL WC-3744 TaxID=1463935 RepID=UPI0009980C59